MYRWVLSPLDYPLFSGYNKPLLILLSPFAPFICEEIWNKIYPKESIFHSKFPKYNEAILVNQEFDYPISINGKKKFNITLNKDFSNDKIKQIIKSNNRVIALTKGKIIIKIIIVKEKIINIVVKS